jgi:hypothetical protein
VADAFPALVRVLARLEDDLPHVTVDDLCQASGLPISMEECRALIATCIADRRLFTDARQRLDPATGARTPVRVVRLNRRHPDVLAHLPD